MRIHREMHLREDLFRRLSALPLCPSRRRKRVRSLCVWRQTDRVKLLQEPNQHERHFIIRKLKSMGDTLLTRVREKEHVRVLTC